MVEEKAHNLEFLPHPKCWPFLGRPLKNVLEFSNFWAGFVATQCKEDKQKKSVFSDAQPFTRESPKLRSCRPLSEFSASDALRVAQNHAKLPPIQEQLESCKTFLERARKRVLQAQAVIDRAIEQKAACESEVAEGQRMLEALQVKAAEMPAPPVVLSVSLVANIGLLVGQGPACSQAV